MHNHKVLRSGCMFCILLLLAASFHIVSSTSLVHVNQTALERFVLENPFVVVLFSSPNEQDCPSCAETIQSVTDAASEAFRIPGLSAPFLNCDDPIAARQHGATHLPFLVTIRNGIAKPYLGFTHKHVLAPYFMKAMSRDARVNIINTIERKRQFQLYDKVRVLGSFEDRESTEARVFEKVCKLVYPELKCFGVYGQNVKAFKQKNIPVVALYQPRLRPVEYEAEAETGWEVEKLYHFLQKKTQPLWVELNEHNIFQSLKSSNLVALIYDPDHETVHATQTGLSVFKSLAQNLQGEDLSFVLLQHREGYPIISTLVGEYGVDELPFFAWIKAQSKDKALKYDKDIKVGLLKEWIQDQLSNNPAVGG